jgi:hypothetical protein
VTLGTDDEGDRADSGQRLWRGAGMGLGTGQRDPVRARPEDGLVGRDARADGKAERAAGGRPKGARRERPRAAGCQERGRGAERFTASEDGSHVRGILDVVQD